jgi:hypothetical protein
MITANPQAVFVDTSGWVGYFVRKDQHHGEAMELFEGLGEEGREILTSDYVISETVTRVRGLSGWKDALRVWEELESGQTAHVMEVNRDLRSEARRLFRKYRELPLSLVDCVSFALMARLGINEALTFDADFEKAGFRRYKKDVYE